MRSLFPALAIFFTLGLRLQAAPIISPDGSAYTSYTASSELNPSYTVDNLFDQNPTVGQEVSLGGSDAGFAYGGGVNVTPLYVEFQLDSVYTVLSLYYAQRDFNNAHNPNFDKSVRSTSGPAPAPLSRPLILESRQWRPHLSRIYRMINIWSMRYPPLWSGNIS